ncbi:30S ribosomal protein S17 [Saccharolobus solfataricus]|uniref:Small ribosomal subunit protein uS17 n=3 Tax=Saccharolobus solfataricus TaxID=2287 RepID=RS17_SACS2|nr:30S ribosomal protein S17 [Saccharolobus solfataricus]Q9UX98.1 RecName: Full=Small ribosomal subunit protein uS17; AltName: Full=30S ribosomal protein S17 [Saccharolobus solfataricus P2]AAK41010.1 SSU ribosomal protein S17AB (rps17AB) [Saccharolobus solfataricus P2]AKA74037.1 30S ribosomal protein S17 [Saccharolobus solfataricus]AKA76734.1 30S ribosomal protein S17 [Saccharolobus solfataricus]AKA79428.1 30S ribosomal protein S17 [Saccharolobus solfataricus]AZF68515.1 30S ribosomal protein 
MVSKGKTVKDPGIPNITIPEKVCEDEDCPYHGSLRVRGITLEGVIVKYRGTKAAVIERQYLYYDSKYKRYERRRSRIHAHVPPCINVREGDKVIIGECRPLSKSISFVVLGKVS